MFHNGKGYDFNLIFSEIFKRNSGKRRMDVLPSTQCKAIMIGVGF